MSKGGAEAGYQSQVLKTLMLFSNLGKIRVGREWHLNRCRMGPIAFLDELSNPRVLDAPFPWRCGICSQDLRNVGPQGKATPERSDSEERVRYEPSLSQTRSQSSLADLRIVLQLWQLPPTPQLRERTLRKGFVVTELL